MSAQKCSWISKIIGIPMSSSTCLRLTAKCDIPTDDTIRHLGIDDWAYKKGHSYGTILVNRETGKTIDLIRSRNKEDIIKWLKLYPDIKSVTRDRAECYSKSISIALPNTIQVADRFHLAVNYSTYVLSTVKKLIPKFKRLDIKVSLHSEDPGIQEIINQAHGQTRFLNPKKRELILKSKELFNLGHSKIMIAKILNIDYRTATKYIDNDLEYFNSSRRPRVDYSSYLEELINGYCKGEKLSVVYRKIEKRGFQGTLRGLSTRFGKIYKEAKSHNSAVSFEMIRREHFPLTLSSRKITIYLTNKRYNKILSSKEIELFNMLRDNNPLLKELWNISLNFRKFFNNKSIVIFQKWITQVMNSPFKSLKRFAKGLITDIETIKAAIIRDDNNGITEGNVNRLKNIKRQMYGRAGFELLRRKVVLSNTG